MSRTQATKTKLKEDTKKIRRIVKQSERKKNPDSRGKGDIERLI